MAPQHNLLLIFYRNPELGKVKTRLAATVGQAKALDIYLKLAAHTQNIALQTNANRVVFYSHQIEENDFWPDQYFKKEVQHGQDLGDRMNHAFEKAFALGYGKICIIGTDCLELSKEVIESAFIGLTHHDIVLGPAKDGGYYLLGMNKPNSMLFENKRWSTHTVTHDTLLDTLKLKRSVKLLPLLSDVDVEEDLRAALL